MSARLLQHWCLADQYWLFIDQCPLWWRPVVRYADKYEEEFAPYFPQFVGDIWTLLTRVAATPRFDSLVVTSLRFLNSVMSKSVHQAVFQVGDAVVAEVARALWAHAVVLNVWCEWARTPGRVSA